MSAWPFDPLRPLTYGVILAPVREHSRKPDQMHTDLERLFARERRAGWDCWGNEVGKFGVEAAAE